MNDLHYRGVAGYLGSGSRMQLAMVAGYVTTYPVNWWLVRTGIKEEM